jgi:hypothetical protein
MKKMILYRFLLLCGILLLCAPPAQADLVTYTYDGAGRLTMADYGLGKAITYRYDPNGNLLEQRSSFSLGNAVRVLQALAGSEDPLGLWDADNDGRVGLAEAIYVFQVLSGLR